MVTSSKHIVFGSGVKRFGKNTGHPNLDPSGLHVKRPDGCDPCLYHPQPINEIFDFRKRYKKNIDPWRYKSELEDWSKNLGYRNQKILEQKRWFDSILGPAWHTISEPAKYEAACKNVGFGRTIRFRSTTNTSPNPGTYYKAVPFKSLFGPHSSKPTFEMRELCRFKDKSPKWSLPPNRYHIIDKDSIQEKSKKLVSRRGPYDLFTGVRDESTIKTHFNTPSKCSAATWPVALEGSLETYKKSHFGVMNKTNREKPCRSRNTLVDLAMCLRKPEEPGPADTNIDKPKIFKQNKYGFNSSDDKPPGYQRALVWPAVGRYNIKGITCGIVGQGHRHIFLSKQSRTIGAILPKPMNSF
ncbi:unnamed protein product [Parnassius mnemosyne]|uniref:Lymphocyte expansion molecule n=1 Tax=Parnassius mnemosyne TaxID=213953 RepID=A0AAV1KZG2_9NEOP